MVTAGRLLLAVVSFSILPAAVAAQQGPRSYVRLELGRAEIHRATDTGSMLGIRVGRGFGTRGVVRFELGSSYSSTNDRFFVLDAGAELRPLAKYRVTPSLGAGAGFIVESKFRGALLRGTLALDIALSALLGLRIGGQAGYHGREEGPHYLFVGLEMTI